MDGVLLKWTNYFSGWQPRYFILEDGILSYYQSKDDINTSCKGSIKVSACDITAHSIDHTRMDIIVPGEAHYYLKASTQQDRQVWLVALGTCKAQSYETTLRFSSPANKREGEIPTGEELLKVKRSELVMYRDLLTQQLYNIKVALKADPQGSVESYNEATTLVNATCESFIGTLEDCMQLVDLNQYMRSRESSFSPNSKSKVFFHKGSSSWGSQPMTRHVSVDKKMSTSRASSEEKDHFHHQSSTRTTSLSSSTSNPGVPDHHHSSGGSRVRNSSSQCSPLPKIEAVPCSNNSDVFTYSDRTYGCCVSNDDVENKVQDIAIETTLDKRLPTFFSQMSMSFVDIKITHDMEIPTVQFLDACRSFISVFDKLDEPAFIIGKLDLAGNIRKVHQKYISSPETFPTIQKILIAELKRKEADDTNSATVALLWLCKSLEFAHDFILNLIKHECSLGQDLDANEMRQMAGEVYDKILKDHHSWVVRSAFYMILPSIPPMDKLICCLATHSNHVDDANFRKSLKSDAHDYLSSLRSILDLLLIFFNVNGLKIKGDLE